jgi:cbb3-type cytochrome c oxidase subunit III
MDRLFKKLTIVASLVCIVFLGLAAIEGNFLREWKHYQSEFADILKSAATTPSQKQAADEFKVEVKQIILDDLKRVDRCVSCHNGIDNPTMSDVPLPHRVHSGEILNNHPVEQFGCSICHGGQDRALSRREAFATDESVHWDYPVIPLKHTQSACGKCHLAVADDEQELTGAEALLHGRELLYENGCLGCHKIRGKGGALGPDLTDQGRKIRHAYTFQHVKGDKTVENWLRAHFQNPQEVTPGSVMPPLDISDEDMDDLITVTMGLHAADLPTRYYDLAYIEEFKGGGKELTGAEMFGRYCAGCHGTDAGGGTENALLARFNPALHNIDFLSAASDDFIRYTIHRGRPGAQMPAWDESNGGFSDAEIDSLVAYARSHEPEPPTFEEVQNAQANKRTGRKLYRTKCAGCQGGKGQGGIGPSLNNQDFLILADEEFLYDTIVNGRANTAMISHKYLKATWIASIIAYMKDWQDEPQVDLGDAMVAGDADSGRVLFQGLCAPCHGPEGQGAVGTALMNADFREAASDQFIKQSILRGRRHRAMRSWNDSGLSLQELSDSDVNDLVAYIRGGGDQPERDRIVSNIVSGDIRLGQESYAAMCAGCHGLDGQGGVGTALGNQEFLRAASDGFLQAAIVRGRAGTPMRPWGIGTSGLQELDHEKINNIVAYIRSWQRPDPGSATGPVASR